MKSVYIDLMETIASAYSTEDILDYMAEVEEYSIREHGFPRLTANIGILLANGRRTELRDTFERMMDLCCREIPVVRQRYMAVSDDPADRAKFPEVGNNFSVREIVTCLLLLEERGTFPKEKTDYWRNLLKTIDPETCYSVIARSPLVKVDNWAAFGAASEQARKFAGIGDESEFIDIQLGSQLLSFDENGMYMDPNEPMCYDAGARIQLSVSLFLGYDGCYREQMDEMTARGALKTLPMQSTTGETPYGGRSNQFLHNEVGWAALCEFEASRYKKLGDMKLAGQFKASANLAIQSLLGYIQGEELYHIKNYYPRHSFFGCENYAHFKKYMITVASFLYLAYLFADDSIEPVACPAEEGNYIVQTSDAFHKTMCKYGEYFVEYETKADFHYDSNGLGRIHKKGAPSAICLSIPFAKTPNYGVDIENPSNLSLGCSVCKDGKWILSSDPETEYVLVNKEVTDTNAELKWQLNMSDGVKIMETCVLSEDGVELSFENLNEDMQGEAVYCMLPVFEYDGKNYGSITSDQQYVQVEYQGHTCRYDAEGSIQDTEKIYANRNGHYRLFTAKGTNKVKVCIKIQ